MRNPLSIFRTKSIRGKLLGAFVVVGAALMGVAIVAVALQLGAARRAALLDAEHIAEAIATDEVQWQTPDRLQRYVVSLGKLFERGIILVGRDGIVIASTDSAQIGQTDARAEVQRAMRSGSAIDVATPSATAAGTAHQVVMPLPSTILSTEMTSPGAVIFEYTQAYDTAMQEAIRAAILTVFAAAVLTLIGWIFAVRFTRSIVSPLADLENAAAAIAGDDYSARIVARGHDEIARSAIAFNKMADKLSQTMAALHQRNGELANANGKLQEETAKQTVATERAEFLAFHDSLTLLPNRASFSDSLTKAVAKGKRFGTGFSVFFVDLDRFKQINDTLGHDAGDQLLMAVGERLRGSLGKEHTVARLGGDEFVVLLDGMIDRREVGLLAQRVLAGVMKPITLGGQELRVTASLGISQFAKDGIDEQTLMKHADIALYQAKEAGRNGFAFYAPERNNNSFERLALESSLRRAIGRNELILQYQPKRDFSDGNVTGMEALVRWQHPELGLVPPAQFIPVAEETGLIVPIGKWVLRTACLQTMQWHKLGISDLVIAVNLSPRQFSDANLLVDIVTILSETGMDATKLELEITESAIMQDPEQARKMIVSLRAMGIRIAVDDFGTGHSSLATLKQFPIDTLKIDRSFIRDLATDADDRSLTEAILSMGRALDLQVVAEGVETSAQADFLRERGCDAMQGFYFSKPIGVMDFELFVTSQRLSEATLDPRCPPSPTGHLTLAE